jgi:predicted nucleic acid-binding protein
MPLKRYWDANVFLGWFNDEPDKVDMCKGVIKLAEDGELVIVTSALTLVEVIWLRGYPKLPSESARKIKRFFEQDYLSVRTVDRVIAEAARQLIWDHNIKPKDSIHLATALSLKLKIFDTFDDDLLTLDDTFDNSIIHIGKPNISYQEELGLIENEEAKE